VGRQVARVMNDGVNVSRALELLWMRRWVIVLVVLFSMGAVYTGSQLGPKGYRAMATVFVAPSTVAIGLRPAPLTVEAHEQIALSGFVVNELLRKARAEKILSESESPVLTTELYPSREPQKPFLSLIGLVVIADDPQKAQWVANAWADVLIAEQGNISTVGRSGVVDFILAEYPKASEELLRLEGDLRAVKDRQARERGTLEASVAVTLLEAQLASRQAALVAAEDRLVQVSLGTLEAQRTIQELGEEITRTPDRLTTRKSMSDEALWQLVGQASRQPAGEAAAVLSTKLETEQVNSVHTELGQRLANERVRYKTYVPLIEMLRQQIATLTAEVSRLRGALVDGKRRLEEQTRLHELERAPHERAIIEAKARWEKLGGQHGDALIAKADRDSDLKIGARAEAPTTPSSPRPALHATLAGAMSFLLSALWVFVVDVLNAWRQPSGAAD
jgi:uncharacterized protein involved in exopolysaccharide biosynthesis